MLSDYRPLLNPMRTLIAATARSWIQPTNLNVSQIALKAFKTTEASKGKKASRKDEIAELYKFKLPSSSFIRFSSELNKKKKISVPEAGKLAGLAWKELSAEEKKPYEDAYQKDREIYAAQIARIPKRPTPGYGLFMKERYAAIKDSLTDTEGAFGKVSKLISEEWKNKSEEEKKPYKDAHEAARVEYIKNVEIFEKERALELGIKTTN